MGTWGTRLTEDDFAADVVGDFFDLYNSGDGLPKIRATLESKFAESVAYPNEGHIFWLALAKAQWDVGALDEDVLQKVEEIVRTDVDTKDWITKGASQAEASERRASIQAFLAKLHTSNPKPKKPNRARLKDSPYETGDILSLQLSDGFFGAAVVFDAQKQTQFGMTGLVVTDLHLAIEPTEEEIKKARVFDPTYYYLIGFRNVKNNLKKIGNIRISKVVKHNPGYSRWENLFRFAEAQWKKPSEPKLPIEDFL